MPNEAAHPVARILKALSQVGVPSFFTMLKPFGPSYRALLSVRFRAGTWLAMCRRRCRGLLEVLDKLDVAAERLGAVYFLRRIRDRQASNSTNPNQSLMIGQQDQVTFRSERSFDHHSFSQLCNAINISGLAIYILSQKP